MSEPRAGERASASGSGPAKPASYPRVLARVLAVQVIALLLLWLLQARFGG